ncbi:Scr1 family TA system antitoxin-like transcriptional regulator [Glycomyces arizonensis]|uniref:Scr1 family TA system antitoxin-like transcriptional regulator n=1 Tax=Glycomyces arizonensis TaxID=256035 RepID=UPI0012EB2B04|nr:Scr1 family TA system antitoxin-like transcriptional regulator [Glycomyces arizonensis]
MTDIEDPTLAPPPLLELGRQLEAERIRPRSRLPRGYTKTDIPSDICSTKTLGRLESGRYRGVNLGTVLKLLRFYQTPYDHADHIARLAEASKARDWCAVYGNVVEDRGWFLQQCEDSASFLCYHASLAIPSLIHSKAYYKMIEHTTQVSFAGDFSWEESWRFRQERRQRWIDSERPAVFLIGEGALRMDLGPERDAILDDLREVAALPFADVRIIPFSAGRYDLQPWSLNLFEYDGDEQPVINVESPRGQGFIAADTQRGKVFRDAFKLASAESIPAEDFLT